MIYPRSHRIRTVPVARPFLHYLLASLLIAGVLGLPETRTANAEDPLPETIQQGRRVSLVQSVEPSFRVDPVVQRLLGRRGETLPFSFELASTGKVMNLEVRPVNLRQEESGIILHDDQSEPAEGVTFTSPTEFVLGPGEKVKIEGTIKVPLTRTNYISFGLLVRDSGQLDRGNNDNVDDGTVRAAIRFVTQYVLRVDIETGEQDVGDMDQLFFDHAELVEKNGLPFVRAYLTNPTPFALESQVRASLVDSSGRDTDPVRLNMASRATLPDEQKYLVRIMPLSRLRLEGPIDGAIATGNYGLEVKLSNGRRVMVKRSFPITIDSSGYRGMRTKLVTLPDGISVHPTQIELGRVAGTERMTTLHLSNHGEQPREIELIPKDYQGNLIQDVMLSSKKFTLKPGRTQTVRAMLRGANETDYQWGTIAVSSDDNQTDLDLALVHGTRPEMRLVPGEIQWANLPSGNAFVIKIENQGEAFEPLFAELKIAATSGHPLDLSEGFGRWLPPGKTRELQFYVPDRTPPGSYQIILKVTSRDDALVADRTLVLELTEEMLRPSQLISR
ncbi:COG1470 family protein [Neorhodopirellula pilleata]|uniref:Uncharacterized protein n=1 Tax=Neorhodopirellula pilleata TaxID=2714738 RepID=A0A5C6ATF9_9BACT|nr:hypothetical protein [Neorhodopirellula pilleata]TWU03285.1 hypothetical protein Pla100_02030 [Neorhodopirellula pilleata]